MLFLAVLVMLPLCAFSLHWFFSSSGASGGRRLTKARRVLLVTAHPDDECMFFTPTIVGLSRQGCDIYLLCLSTGAHKRGESNRRKAELFAAVAQLGMDQSLVVVLNNTRLPDGPGNKWLKRLIAEIVLRYIEQLDIDTVITFDSYGVSGHPNHAAIFHAVQHLYTFGRLPRDTQAFVLESVSIWRKYFGLFDVLPSVLSSNFCYVSDWSGIALGVSAMTCHWSQLVWFRVLYLAFSRYMIVNTLKRIAMQKRFYSRDDSTVVHQPLSPTRKLKPSNFQNHTV